MAAECSIPGTCELARGVRSLELHGPRNGLKRDPRSSGGVPSMPLFFRPDAESADNMGRQARQRRFSGGPG
eukprot:7614098-Alexandrium_andersonii.AAC.1